MKTALRVEITEIQASLCLYINMQWDAKVSVRRRWQEGRVGCFPKGPMF